LSNSIRYSLFAISLFASTARLAAPAGALK
jgi:hypothetical protein